MWVLQSRLQTSGTRVKRSNVSKKLQLYCCADCPAVHASALPIQVQEDLVQVEKIAKTRPFKQASSTCCNHASSRSEGYSAHRQVFFFSITTSVTTHSVTKCLNNNLSRRSRKHLTERSGIFSKRSSFLAGRCLSEKALVYSTFCVHHVTKSIGLQTPQRELLPCFFLPVPRLVCGSGTMFSSPSTSACPCSAASSAGAPSCSHTCLY